MSDELHSFGNYEILEKIASGGMASVYLAKRKGLHGFEKVVAVKKILEHLADNEEFLDMFVNEAKLAAQLTHQNIVQIFELGKIGNSFFMVMEFVQGKDLRNIMKSCYAKKIHIPLLSLEIVRRVCAGLDYAHRKRDLNNVPLNIVHRDISPQNILVSYEGDVKVTDFGIAKAAIQNQATRAGVLKGKVSYMSPEQAWGKVIDHRSDIFSTGIILYELITGKKCFKGETPLETLEYVREGNYESAKTVNPKIPEEINNIIDKALAKNPTDRYQYASEMKDDIEQFIYSSNYPKDSFNITKFMRIVFKDDISREESHLGELMQRDLSREEKSTETKKVIFSTPESTPPTKPLKSEKPVEKKSKKEPSIKLAREVREAENTSPLITIMKTIIYILLPFLFFWNFYPTLYRDALNYLSTDRKVNNILNFRIEQLPSIILGISKEVQMPTPTKTHVQFTKVKVRGTGFNRVMVDNEPAEFSEKDGDTLIWGVETRKTHLITLIKPGYTPVSFEVKVEDVIPVQVFTPELIPDELMVRFMTEPPGAKIYFENEELEFKTPYEMELEEADRNKIYEYGFEVKNFGIYTSTFLPGDATYIPLYHKFVKEFGTLELKVEPKGLIFLGKKQIGLSKDGKPFIKRMLVGKYKLRIYNPDAEITQYLNVEIQKDKKSAHEIKLNVNVGWVRIITNPPNLRVLVDGKDVGLSPINKLKLPIGVHKIEVQNEQGNRIYERVIKPNQITAINVNY